MQLFSVTNDQNQKVKKFCYFIIRLQKSLPTPKHATINLSTDLKSSIKVIEYKEFQLRN